MALILLIGLGLCGLAGMILLFLVEGGGSLRAIPEAKWTDPPGKMLISPETSESSSNSSENRDPAGVSSGRQDFTFYRSLTEPQEGFSPDAADRPELGDSPKAAAKSPVSPRKGPSKGYTLQVGSFQEKQSAQRLVRHLVGKGYPAYWVKADLGGEEVRYRVRVGSFSDKQDARKLAERLENREGLKSFVAYREGS